MKHRVGIPLAAAFAVVGFMAGAVFAVWIAR